MYALIARLHACTLFLDGCASRCGSTWAPPRGSGAISDQGGAVRWGDARLPQNAASSCEALARPAEAAATLHSSPCLAGLAAAGRGGAQSDGARGRLGPPAADGCRRAAEGREGVRGNKGRRRLRVPGPSAAQRPRWAACGRAAPWRTSWRPGGPCVRTTPLQKWVRDTPEPGRSLFPVGQPARRLLPLPGHHWGRAGQHPPTPGQPQASPRPGR